MSRLISIIYIAVVFIILPIKTLSGGEDDE